MNTPDDLTQLRRYTRPEVAAMLKIPPTWLKRWVTADLVPHQRSGAQRGVWFTYADICEIGRVLPSLMTPRQANSRAEGHAVDGAPCNETGAATGAALGITDDDLAFFRDLRSLR